jgi:rhodanese-related sulfurtransferase
MMLKNSFVQGVLLIAVALVLALVSNGFASRTRRLVLVGYYPNALVVPPRQPDTPPPPIGAAAPAPVTTTVAQSPAPGQPPMVVETSTIARPAGATTTATATIGGPAPASGVVTPPGASPATTTSSAGAATAPQVTPAAPQADPLARFAPHPDKASVEISGDDAALLYSKGVLFLDARRTSVYEEGHIAGARSYSVWEADVDDKVNQLYEERSDPREQNLPIVIYCSGGACEDSHMLAQKLWNIQFNNVYVYKDGFPDWQKRNGATRTGGQP